MAATEQSGPATDPRACGSGPEFVRDRLAESESPMGAIELSEEYDCTHGYMRDILSDLTSEGVIKRVATGRYTAAGDADDLDEETGGSVPSVPDDGIADVPVEHDDIAGVDEMPTQEEYRQQHSDSDDGSADISATSEVTGSAGNTSAAPGSDGSDDTGSADVEAAPNGALPMGPKALGTVLAAGVALWLVSRALSGDDSEPELDADDDQADADDDPDLGGLVS